MAVKFTNNAATTLAAGINSSVTSIAVTDGSVFPTITGSDHFYVTFDDTTNKEIVKVTARSGNTLTVVRGHDNTTARAFSSGDKAELRIVAALLDDVKTDVSSTLTVDTFTSDGTTAEFTLSVAPASEDNLIVFIEGVYQNPGDFTLSGTSLTLDAVPPNTRKVVVYHVSHLVSGNNLAHNQFTCNGSTTAFTLSLSPIHENNTQVFLDGVYQQKTDYAVSGTTLTMDTASANGAILEVMTFTQTEVNTLPASFVSGLTEVTAVGADHFMIFDATDSALKKSLVSDVLESATSISTSADATAITIDSSENVTFTNNVTINSGQLTAGGLAYPTSDGSNGQVLTTNGSGTLSFSTVSGTTINNNADNRIITGSGTANTLEGEANLTFDNTNLVVGTTGSLKVPNGTDAQKPTAATGMIRYNTTNTKLEAYIGSAWENVNTTAQSLTAISGLDLWADVTGGISSTTIADLSGNNRTGTLSNTGHSGTLNGNTYMLFNAANRYLSYGDKPSGLGNYQGDVTFFFVLTNTTGFSTYRTLIGDSSGAAAYQILRTNGSTDDWNFYLQHQQGATLTSTNTPLNANASINSTQILIFSFGSWSSGDLDIYKRTGGVETTDSYSSVFSSNLATWGFSSNTSSTFYIGNSSWANEYYDGGIFAWGIIDHEITSSEKQIIYDYYATKNIGN